MDEEAAYKFIQTLDETKDEDLRFRQVESLPGVWLVVLERRESSGWWTTGVISSYSHLRVPHRSEAQ